MTKRLSINHGCSQVPLRRGMFKTVVTKQYEKLIKYIRPWEKTKVVQHGIRKKKSQADKMCHFLELLYPIGQPPATWGCWALEMRLIQIEMCSNINTRLQRLSMKKIKNVNYLNNFNRDYVLTVWYLVYTDLSNT